MRTANHTRKPSLPYCADLFDTPDVEHALLAAPLNIFFLRTTVESELSSLEECVIASAAARNPGARLNVFSNGLSCGRLATQADHSATVRIVRYEFEDVFAPYPNMLRWYESGAWAHPDYQGAILGDALRLVLLHRYGKGPHLG